MAITVKLRLTRTLHNSNGPPRPELFVYTDVDRKHRKAEL